MDLERLLQPALHRRLYHGVRKHLDLRIMEWATTGLLLQFGWILYFPPNVFEISPNMTVMARIATEETWGLGCLIIGSAHFLALTINGTFRSFQLSPHIRATCCLLGLFVWVQVTAAFWLSGVGGTANGTYRLIALMEFYNLTRAARDMGIVEGRRRRDDP